MMSGASAIRGRLLSTTMMGAKTSSQNGDRARTRPEAIPSTLDNTKAMIASARVIPTSLRISPVTTSRHSSRPTSSGVLIQNAPTKPALTTACQMTRVRPISMMRVAVTLSST